MCSNCVYTVYRKVFMHIDIAPTTPMGILSMLPTTVLESHAHLFTVQYYVSPRGSNPSPLCCVVGLRCVENLYLLLDLF